MSNTVRLALLFLGPGSTIQYSQEVTAVLHNVIGQVKVALRVSRVHIMDIPCGDMAWMSRFLETREDVDYTGMDIVPDLIENHRKKFKHKTNWRFLALDALEEPLPNGTDIIICRMMLQHLFLSDIQRLLSKFSQSGAKYLLATTFSRLQKNSELATGRSTSGRFRQVNLEIPPVSLAPTLCLARDGPPGNSEGQCHFPGLWRLPLKQVVPCSRPQNFGIAKFGTGNISVSACVRWSF